MMKKLLKSAAAVLAASLLLFIGCSSDSGSDDENLAMGGGDLSQDGEGNTGDKPSEGSTVDKPTTEVPVNATVQIVKSEGWLNSAYIIFEQIEGATYTVKCDDVAIDEPLIRYYDEYVWYEPTESADLSVRWERKTLNNVVRADALGLAAGNHTMSVCANGTNGSTDYSSVTMTVADHDRQGFAFTGTETPGAYNKDGTLKSGTVVLYVTKDTAKTVSYNGYTGLQDILSEKSLKNMTVPLDVRIIGTIMLSDMDRIDSSAEGLQIKNNKSAVTVEGVGHDAAINGFGVLIRSAKYVEFANLGIYNFMDDGISIDTANLYLWMHNNDIFYGKVGGDSDQAKGDGSLDFKKSTYSTNSYNHFWDSGKCCLLDASASSSGGSNYLTYHHNWFDHSDSRHPRIRNASAVHVYNNYYDGNAKYGIGITSGASCLSEGNFFRNCKFPMMSSLQGNDIYAGTDKADAANNGTFSKEEGGIIKAFNNHIEGAVTSYWPYNGTGTNWTKGAKDSLPSGIDTKVHFDTYEVSERASILTSDVKTVVGAHTYSNFDTELGNSGLGLSRVPTQPEQARTDVISYSGRHNPDFVWEFDNATEDTNSNVIAELKSAVTNYAGKLTKIQNTGSSGSSGDSGSTGGNTGNEGGGTEGGDTDVPVTPPATGSAVVALVSNGAVSPTDSRVTCNSCSINTKDTNGAISIVYNEVSYTTIKMESSSTIQVQTTAGSTITVVGSLPLGKQSCFKYAKKGDETNKTTVKLADKTTETTTTFQKSFTSTGNDVIMKGDTASIGVIIITEAE